MKARIVLGFLALSCHRAPPEVTYGPDVPLSAMAEAKPDTPELATLYTVTKDEDIAGLNRKVSIVLFKREKLPTLEAICRRIHASDAHQHETTFFFLDVQGEPPPPQMAHWAIARLEPELTVRILGDE